MPRTYDHLSRSANSPRQRRVNGCKVKSKILRGLAILIMQLLADILILIIKTLIKIGDTALFALNLILKSLLAIWRLLFSLAKQPSKNSREARFILARKKLKAVRPKRAKPKVVFESASRIKLRLRFFLEGTIFSLVFIFIPMLIFISLQSLPKPESLNLRFIPQTTKIYDRNGTLLYQIYTNENRTLVPLSEIPKSLQEATIAIEDKDFYKHPGFDVSAIIRSAVENLSGKDLQGGSTITQQLIKSALLTPEASITRKIKEIILAFWTERVYSKNQILEMYFNQVPYGGTAWGVEAASEIYFGKGVRNLNLAQSAFLAGMPRAPTVYSPFGTQPALWKKRQKEVLRRMVELNYVTKKEAVEAEEEKLIFQTPQIPIYAAHFVMYVKDLLVKKYGLPMVEKGGLTVVTTLDLKTQELAQKIVSEEVQNNTFLNLTNGAVLITNPKKGDILAMVGGKNYEDPNGGNVNVTTSLRQPGSSIKIVTYGAALSRGFTAATILDDSPATFTSPGAPSYSPVNYDGKFHGKVSLRMAFANSFNVPAVKTLNQIGVLTMVDLGKKMGIKSWGNPNQYGLSITLGGADVTMLDMAAIYGVLANGGWRVDASPFLKITDSRGNVLEEKRDVFEKQVLDEGVAFIISDILSDNLARAWEFGTNSPLNIPGHTVPVKTGTSDNKRDNWTIGYTKDRVVVAWVGNNDNSPMSPILASGITGAAPIWNRIMSSLLAGTPEQKQEMPTGVVRKDCLGRKEYFIKGTENSVNCTPLPIWTPTPNP